MNIEIGKKLEELYGTLSKDERNVFLKKIDEVREKLRKRYAMECEGIHEPLSHVE